MFENLSKTIESISKIEVSDERKEVLKPLVEYIQNKVNLNEEIRLNFICTHNSRRSHLSHIWAQTMAFQFGIKNVFCYSGGTEATAMFPKVGETLVNQGFQIQKLSEEQNPVSRLSLMIINILSSVFQKPISMILIRKLTLEPS